MAFLYFGGLIALVTSLMRLWRRLNPPISDVQSHPSLPGLIYGFRENDGLADRIHLGLGVRDQLRFSLRREHGWDQFAKWIRLAREIQSGDAAFDRELYVIGEDPRLVDFLGGDHAFRAEALDLLSRFDVHRIDCFEGTLSVTVTCRLKVEPQDDNTLREIQEFAATYLPALHRLAARLDAFRSIPWDDADHPLPRRHARFNGMTLALGVVSLLTLFALGFGDDELPRPLDTTNAGHWALVPALMAATGFAAAAWHLLRGSSILHIAILELVVLGGSSVFAMAFVAASIYNVRADVSPATVDVVRIVDKTIVEQSGRPRITYHYLIFDAPSPLLGAARLDVSPWVYRFTEPGDCVELRRYPGALGDPWIAPLRQTRCAARRKTAAP
jgi:hypothetical protein